LNLYTYVGNNPIRYIDPSGHMIQENTMDHNCGCGGQEFHNPDRWEEFDMFIDITAEVIGVNDIDTLSDPNASKVEKVWSAISLLPSPLKGIKLLKFFEGMGKVAGETKVLGRLQDTAVAKEWKDHDVLNIKDWTIAKNDAWVQEGIKNKQNFYTASPITKGNLWDDIAGRETVYARELRMITEAGYVKRGDYYIHPANFK
jgi:hypothetical protein